MKKLIKSFPKRIHEDHISASGRLLFERMRNKDVAKFRKWNLNTMNSISRDSYYTCIYVNRDVYLDVTYRKDDKAPCYCLTSIDISLLN